MSAVHRANKGTGPSVCSSHSGVAFAMDILWRPGSPFKSHASGTAGAWLGESGLLVALPHRAGQRPGAAIPEASQAAAAAHQPFLCCPECAGLLAGRWGGVSRSDAFESVTFLFSPAPAAWKSIISNEVAPKCWQPGSLSHSVEESSPGFRRQRHRPCWMKPPGVGS